MIYILPKRKCRKIARNNIDFVSWMRKNDREHWNDNQSFINGYSKRKMYFEQIQLSTTNEDDFVKDLIKSNILIVKKKNYITALITNKIPFIKKTPYYREF